MVSSKPVYQQQFCVQRLILLLDELIHQRAKVSVPALILKPVNKRRFWTFVVLYEYPNELFSQF
jgi:hypothetical protein